MVFCDLDLSSESLGKLESSVIVSSTDSSRDLRIKMVGIFHSVAVNDVSVARQLSKAKKGGGRGKLIAKVFERGTDRKGEAATRREQETINVVSKRAPRSSPSYRLCLRQKLTKSHEVPGLSRICVERPFPFSSLFVA